MIMLAPFSGPWLVCTTKVYPGLGADIVMESITLKTPTRGRTNSARLRERLWLLKNSFQGISTTKFVRKLLNVRSP
jgi:hypothetical protein